uniref:C2H2-type domain-containing protein n=1 Tax=Anopheles christyi TaxID=43041 RepID=A0A182JTF8_9DIPT
MTMDVKQSRMNVKIAPPIPDQQDHHPLHQHVASTKMADRKTTTGTKRSFDVAFLMLPDEKLAAARNGRATKRPLPPAPSPTIDVESDSTQSEDLSVKGGFSPIRSPEVERHFPLDMLNVGRQRALLVDGLSTGHTTHPLIHHPQQPPHVQHQHSNHHHHHHHHHQQLQHTGSEERLAYLFNPGARFYEHPFGGFGRSDSDSQRSAFQKVSSVMPAGSPLPPLSPDRHSCPSTSPPISISPSGSQTGSAGGFRTYEYGPFLSPSPGSSPSAPPGLRPGSASPSAKSTGAAVTAPPLPMLYRPADPTDSPLPGTPYFPGVPPFALPPFAAGPAAPPMPEAVDGIIRNPAAAAILSTLLPSAMSTFTLSAQNVCAKCNISFRMTSDLVYHMRSHHKSEHVHDHARRKREDKLKCPVCNESFRERHHLTRHMTAHQDKAGDLLEKAPNAGVNGKGASTRHHHHQQQQQQHHHHHHHHQQQQQHLHVASQGRLA